MTVILRKLCSQSLSPRCLESIIKDLFYHLKLCDVVVPACEYGCPWGPEDSDGYLKGELQLVVSFLTPSLPRFCNIHFSFPYIT